MSVEEKDRIVAEICDDLVEFILKEARKLNKPYKDIKQAIAFLTEE